MGLSRRAGRRRPTAAAVLGGIGALVALVGVIACSRTTAVFTAPVATGRHREKRRVYPNDTGDRTRRRMSKPEAGVLAAIALALLLLIWIT